jgi:hypothetical protein
VTSRRVHDGSVPAPDLPFVDEHARDIACSPEQTWAALSEYVARLTSSSHSVFFRVLFGALRTVPRSGFRVAGSDPPREIVLTGEHRFSSYRLVFRVEPTEGGSRLRALTYAAFPGVIGGAYRLALMASTGHARATRAMLSRVAQHAER